MAAKPEYVESLARGLSVLQAFGDGEGTLSLADVARRVDLPRASVRRILFTLTELGFVAQHDRQFSLTPDVLKFARAYLAANGVSRVLQGVCEDVTLHTGEACSAAVRRDLEVVFIARARPEGILTVGLEIGYRLPAHCTSVGRVLMAGLSDPQLDGLLASTSPEAVTERTRTDIDLIKAAILTARSQGYCIVDQEAEIGFRSIAVPVRRLDGEVVAALNIGAPADRISIGRMIDGFLPVLTKAADRAGALVV